MSKNVYSTKIEIFLKELNVSDVSKNYVSWLNDYEIVKYTEQKYKKHTLKNVKSFVFEKRKSKSEFLYGIYLKKNFTNKVKKKNNQQHVGNIKLGVINFHHKYAYISYFVGDKRVWGKGIATKAIAAIIKIAAKKFKLKKLIAGAYAKNIGSIRVLEKNNFVKEAILKDKLLFQKKRHDHILYGLII